MNKIASTTLVKHIYHNYQYEAPQAKTFETVQKKIRSTTFWTSRINQIVAKGPNAIYKLIYQLNRKDPGLGFCESINKMIDKINPLPNMFLEVMSIKEGLQKCLNPDDVTNTNQQFFNTWDFIANGLSLPDYVNNTASLVTSLGSTFEDYVVSPMLLASLGMQLASQTRDLYTITHFASNFEENFKNTKGSLDKQVAYLKSFLELDQNEYHQIENAIQNEFSSSKSSDSLIHYFKDLRREKMIVTAIQNKYKSLMASTNAECAQELIRLAKTDLVSLSDGEKEKLQNQIMALKDKMIHANTQACKYAIIDYIISWMLFLVMASSYFVPEIKLYLDTVSMLIAITRVCHRCFTPMILESMTTNHMLMQKSKRHINGNLDADDIGSANI
jgi:hypothetical protein